MYSNLTSSQALSLATRISSEPTRFFKYIYTKSQSLPMGSVSKPPLNPSFISFSRNGHRTYIRSLGFSKSTNFSLVFCNKSMQMGALEKPRRVSSVMRVKCAVQCCDLIRGRGFSSLSSVRVDERSPVLRAGRPLASLKSNKVKEAKRLGKVISAEASRSSWEASAERLEDVSSSHSSWEESAKRLEKVTTTNIGRSLEESTKTFSRTEEHRERVVDMSTGHQNVYAKNQGTAEEEGEEMEAVSDSKWNKRRNSFRRDVKARTEKPEYQRWNRQENSRRTTWKEAAPSTVPKMVGEGLYGVGPVLAALSAKTREFYALYVQEGLSLSSNNRKKKDKKGYEKVLKMAENMGISIKETSKHDLNMVVGNRPHQGLVLDASPLEMVKIKELDPISADEDQASLWVALDEVTDPQNLGAIIRSAYFFGASGVVLCAKNSAPLSGVVSKASAGSLELVELRYCNNMMQFLVSSAENGWRVLGGSVSSKAVPLNEIPPGQPTILVLGSEGTGLRPLVERSCTHLVRIPGNIPVDVTAGEIDDVDANGNHGSAEQFQSFMAVESLNVSVAAGVLLHHLVGHQVSNNSHIEDSSTATVD